MQGTDVLHIGHFVYWRTGFYRKVSHLFLHHFFVLVPKEREEKHVERERKSEGPSGFGRIPKVSDKVTRHDSPRPSDHKSERDRSDRERQEREKIEKLQKERARLEKDKAEREKEREDKERLDKLRAEREKIERDIDRLNRDRERLEKAKLKLESSSKSSEKPKSLDKYTDRAKFNAKESVKQDVKKNIDLKSQNTYRIDKNSNDKKFTIPSKNSDGKYMNGHSAQSKPVPKSREPVQQNGIKDKAVLAKQKALFGDGSQKNNDKRLPDGKGVPSKRPDDRKMAPPNGKAGPSKPPPKMSNSFDFDKHVSSIGKNGARKPDGTRQFPPGDVRRKGQLDGKKPKRK